MNNQISRDDYGFIIETFGVIEVVDATDKGYMEAFEHMITDTYWTKEISSRIDSGNYDDADAVIDRVIDVSDWWAQDEFTQQEIYGLAAGLEQVVYSIW